MKNGARGSDLLANSRGTGPATPVSPGSSASDESPPEKFREGSRPIFARPAAIELTRQDFEAPESEAPDDDGAAGIEAEFRRWIAGLRRLPRKERAAALRTAREWYLLALTALGEKRARERNARHMARRQQRPSPG
jgi:hypothetical protein